MRYWEDTQTSYFAYFVHAWPQTTKNDSINLYTTLTFIFMQIINFIFHTFLKIFQRYCKLDIFDKLWRLSECKNSTWSCTSLLAYWKNIATFYIGNFGHVWIHPSKIRVSTCRKRCCLSTCKKLIYPYILS